MRNRRNEKNNSALFSLHFLHSLHEQSHCVTDYAASMPRIGQNNIGYTAVIIKKKL